MIRTFVVKNLLGIRRNYWFWPGLLTALGLVCGFWMPFIDVILGSDWLKDTGLVAGVMATGARDVLSTIATAVLGVAGVTYSITIVAVSYASGNFGPRLVGNFMRDRLNQVVLGFFLATFVYSLMVLRSVHDGSDGGVAFVPQISLLIAVGLAVISVGALIVFIHHVPESIDIMNLAAEVGETLRSSVIALIDEEDAEHQSIRRIEPSTPRSERQSVSASASGYLQFIDLATLRSIAEANDLSITVLVGPGHFVTPDDEIFEVRHGGPLSETVAAEIASCVVLGRRRTGSQDLSFHVDQLVEMVGRALSPSMNDPHTAMICMDWLRAGLAEYARRAPQPPVPGDGPLIYKRITFEELLERAFGRSRQYVSSDRNVTLHVLEILAALAAISSTAERAELLRAEMRTLAQSAGEQLAESAARAEVVDRLRSALVRCGDPAETA